MLDNEKHQNTSRYANTGYGPQFAVLDIGVEDKVAVIEPDSAFWALVDVHEVGKAMSTELVDAWKSQAAEFREEMNYLRFGLKPSAVYFNPTERCNFNCGYCYLPESMRKSGDTMSTETLCQALEILRNYFRQIVPEDVKPQVIFHGSEPMIAKESMFAGIESFRDDFHFGIQTNATLLDDEAISFLKANDVGIGISLDAPGKDVADKIRKNWNGQGGFEKVVAVMDKLADYPSFNVITTVTAMNVHLLTDMVDFYHDHGVGVIMLNPVRCTLEGGRNLKPDNEVLANHFFKALDRTYELYEKTGKKLVVANFANVLAAVAGPTSRRLMCDISPCGGGRCFFAVSAKGDAFPCSEFIGCTDYKGGNIFRDKIELILKSKQFQEVTGRRVEDIFPCNGCAIRHFCGAPCPAEVKMQSGQFDTPSPYCQFYEEQVRYAFRVIANGLEHAYLWDGWEEDTEETYQWSCR